MIVVFGTICLDRVRRVPFLPPKGSYVEVLDEQTLLGGEAANTAHALLKWGQELDLYGNCLGEGPDAGLILELCRAKGLPTGNLSQGPVPPIGATGKLRRARTPEASPKLDEQGSPRAPVCDIYVTPDGDRTMFGTGFSTAAKATDAMQVKYRKGCWFTTDPNLADTARSAILLAKSSGMKPYLMDFVGENDPIPEGSLWQSSTDWAGFQGNTQKNVGWANRWIEAHGCFAILSDGPNGFVAGSPSQKVRSYPPFPCPKLVDSTGAGDVFRAGMLLGLERGWEMALCLQFASAAGCLVCGAFGANNFVPSEREILDHIAAHPEVADRYR